MGKSIEVKGRSADNAAALWRWARGSSQKQLSSGMCGVVESAFSALLAAIRINNLFVRGGKASLNPLLELAL